MISYGCPVCANRAVERGVNDLATTHPALTGEWDAERNAPLTPEQVVAGSERRVWWRCEKGHAWQAAVCSRAGPGGRGCPVCASKVVLPGENDLATMFPRLAAEWDAERNAPLTPEQVMPYTNRRIWCRCPLGHGYQALISARAMDGSGCPYCAGKRVLAGFNDLATWEPKVAVEWHPSLNGALTPERVTPGSRKKVWWRCAEGHIWQAVVYSRTGPQRCGCPYCAGRRNPQRERRYRLLLE